MHRILLPILIAAVAAPGGEAAAQRSDNSGFMLGAHLNASTVGTTGRGTQLRSGPGAGIELGYGFNDRIAVYLGIDGAEIRNESGENASDTFVAASADVGARVSFGNPSNALRPYLTASSTALALSETAAIFGLGADEEPAGGGLNIGIGVQYFFRRVLAVDAAFQVTTGSFTQVTVDEERSEIPGVPFQYGRLQLGLTWHP